MKVYLPPDSLWYDFHRLAPVPSGTIIVRSGTVLANHMYCSSTIRNNHSQIRYLPLTSHMYCSSTIRNHHSQIRYIPTICTVVVPSGTIIVRSGT